MNKKLQLILASLAFITLLINANPHYEIMWDSESQKQMAENFYSENKKSTIVSCWIFDPRCRQVFRESFTTAFGATLILPIVVPIVFPVVLPIIGLGEVLIAAGKSGMDADAYVTGCFLGHTTGFLTLASALYLITR